MKSSIQLTTEQKIQLQKDMGVVADELTLTLASEVGAHSFSDEDDVFIALGKHWTVSNG